MHSICSWFLLLASLFFLVYKTVDYCIEFLEDWLVQGFQSSIRRQSGTLTCGRSFFWWGDSSVWNLNCPDKKKQLWGASRVLNPTCLLWSEFSLNSVQLHRQPRFWMSALTSVSACLFFRCTRLFLPLMNGALTGTHALIRREGLFGCVTLHFRLGCIHCENVSAAVCNSWMLE